MRHAQLECLVHDTYAPAMHDAHMPMYATLDQYAAGTTVFYTAPAQERQIVQTSTGFVVPHPKISEVQVSLHDTYKLDRYNNPYGGHTTVNLSGGGKIRMSHDK